MQNTEPNKNRPALVYGLVNVIELDNSAGKIYTPEDPYDIYRKLSEIFASWKLKETITAQQIGTLDKPYDMFHYCAESNMSKNYIGFLFIKWLHQEVPDFIWKYNTYLNIHHQVLVDSIVNQADELVWIDTPGLENKIKQAYTKRDLFITLKNGSLAMPSYKEIQAQVSEWGKETRWQGNNPRNTAVQYNMPYHDLEEPTSSINII